MTPHPAADTAWLRDPLFDPHARYHLSDTDYMALTIDRAKDLHARGLVGSEAWRGGQRQAHFPDLVRTLGWISAFDISLVSVIGNQGLAGNALLLHGSTEQIDAYRNEIDRMDTIYCFAVTEIARGTNLVSIGTEVHYTPADHTLRVVTPTDGAAKYWIGNSLYSATHAMLLARLIIDGTDHGHHWFRVPLRPTEGALPFPGVRIREAGPKGGLTGNQTGMLHFTNHPIPVDALLSGWAHIDHSGNYTSTIARRERFLKCLGTFFQERIFPVTGAACVLRRCAAITLHYSTHREVTGAPLITYPHYQQRLMPQVAQAVALHHLTEHLIEQWTASPDPTAPATPTSQRALYGLTSAAKAYASWAANTSLGRVP